MDKSYLDDLPSYDSVVRQWYHRRRYRRWIRVCVIVGFFFFTYYFTFYSKYVSKSPNRLSISKLQAQHASCAALRQVPVDPVGPRLLNKRWINGTRPLLIKNATVWTGEPSPGTSDKYARLGIGYNWVTSDVLVDHGLIVKVGPTIDGTELPEDCVIYDARGRQLTAGIVDMHSHAGLGGFGSLGDDTNELSGDITPYVKSLDGFNPIHPEIQWIKSGGVTASLILPGSGNNIGGQAFVVKMASGKSNGRTEISQEDMLADPDKTWRYMKMACGENPKRVYGKIGRGPFSRLGEAWEFRHAFEQAKKYVESQDDWCHTADQVGAQNMNEYLPSDIQWESLGAVLRGQVRVNTHCYTIPDLEAYVRHTNEFKFRVYAFHHAHQTYLVPEVLKRAYGGTPAAALFADNMYYKVEAYTASEKAGKILYDEGITPIYVSDNPVLNSQHVVFEAAKAYANGLPYHIALAGVTSAPAELLGLGERMGKIKEGFDADIVVWDSDPLSVAATPVQVWIDGAPQFEKPIELKKPQTTPIEPDLSLQKDLIRKEKTKVIFMNVTRDLRVENDDITGEFLNLIVHGSEISCIGLCKDEISAAMKDNYTIVELQNGHLTPSFTAFGSSLGLMEIDSERATQDGGYNDESFPRAVDGLALDGKQLATAFEHGTTKAISAPSRGSIEAKGVSVGFLTGSLNSLAEGAIWLEEVAVHYPLTQRAKAPSISSSIGNLRKKLVAATKPKKKEEKEKDEPYSEDHYLREVVSGKLPLVISVHKADTIAAIIRMKKSVDKIITKEFESSKKPPKLRVVILGGAESYLVAKELADASISVILAPLLPYSQSWDERRSLSGAPLSNGTAIDVLLDAGVLVGIGVNEMWETRGLHLMAGWAWRNGEGRLTEKEAIALAGANIYKILGIADGSNALEWLVWDGNPLDIGGRLRGVGSNGNTVLWT